MEVYDRIVRQFSGERRYVVQALLRLAACSERLGLEQASRIYETILQKYSDFHEIAREARARLNGLERARRERSPAASEGIRIRQLKIAGGEPVDDVRISPDGTKILHVTKDGRTLSVYDSETRQSRVLFVWNWVEDTVWWKCHWSFDSKSICMDYARKGQARSVVVIDVQTGLRGVFYHDPRADTIPLGWSPDGTQILCATLQRDTQKLSLALVGANQRVGRWLPFPEQARPDWNTLRMDPTGTRVVYSSAEVNPQVYVARLEAPLSPVPITRSPGRSDSPIWSPDSRHVAFRSDRTGTQDLWAVEVRDVQPAGEPFRIKKELGDAALVDWLKNGWLTYATYSRMNDVWIQPIDPSRGELAGRPYVIGGQRGVNAHPAWSRDSRRVVYRSRRTPRTGIYVTDLEDGSEKEILQEPMVQNPVWTADGKILFHKMDPSRLMELDPVSGATRPFLEHEILKLANPSGSFSPDGTLLLFDAPTGDPRVGRLYLYDRQSVREIPGTEGARGARWSRDGSWIVFARDVGRFLFVMKPNGSEFRQVFMLPENEGIQFFALSPDDRFVVYAKYKGLSIAPGLWLASLDGSVHLALDWSIRANISRVEWSPDGRRLAIGAVSGASEFWVMENFFPETH